MPFRWLAYVNLEHMTTGESKIYLNIRLFLLWGFVLLLSDVIYSTFRI